MSQDKQELPPGFEKCRRQVEKEEAHLYSLFKKHGIVGLKDTLPELYKSMVEERIWKRWAMKQSGEDVAKSIMRVATLFKSDSEPFALLVEASFRVENTRPRKIKK